MTRPDAIDARGVAARLGARDVPSRERRIGRARAPLGGALVRRSRHVAARLGVYGMTTNYAACCVLRNGTHAARSSRQ